MSQSAKPDAPSTLTTEPRWPVVVAVLAVGGLYFALPESISVGPRWLLLAIVTALLVPAVIAHMTNRVSINLVLGHVIAGVITLFVMWSIGLLIVSLPAHTADPVPLLRSAGCLWLTNVLVFAMWYWRLDAGGPHKRDQRPGHPDGAFLFPQMTAGVPHDREKDGTPWSPQFVDYLFLAFNTSTAISPTDAPVLSRWAKVLMMLQSLMSLTIIAILVGRAINIL